MRKTQQKGLLAIQIVLAVIMCLCVLLKSRGGPVFIFWPAFLSLVLVSLFIVLISDRKYKIISLVILEVALCCIYMLSLPYSFQMGRDVYFESEFATTIAENGVWNPLLGTGFAENYYGYNPTIHFILAFLSLITGISTYALSKYVLFILLRALLVLSSVMLISLFINKEKERIVYLAAFLFIASFGMSFIEISRRLIADIFLLLSLYALIKSSSGEGGRRWGLLFYIFSSLVIVSNHSVAYLYMLLLFAVWLFGVILNAGIFGKFLPKSGFAGEKYFGILKKLAFVLGVFFIWEAANSFVLLKNDLLYVGSISGLLMKGDGIKLLIGSGSPVASSFIYWGYEKLTLYLYHSVFLLFGFFGLIYYLMRLMKEPSNEMRAAHKALLMIMGVSSLVMYVLAFTLIRTELDSAAYTFLWLFCIPITLFVAYFADYLYVRTSSKRIFTIFLIILTLLMFTGHIFSGIYTPRLVNRTPSENLVLGIDIRAKIPELYHSAEWLARNADTDSGLLGDMNAFEIYGGLFGFDVSTDKYNLNKAYNGTTEQFEEMLLDSELYFGSYQHTYRNGMADYIIIDSRYYTLPSHLFEQPLDSGKLAQLGQTHHADRIYDNGIISIYQNRNAMQETIAETTLLN